MFYKLQIAGWQFSEVSNFYARYLFIHLLCFCTIVDPVYVWVVWFVFVLAFFYQNRAKSGHEEQGYLLKNGGKMVWKQGLFLPWIQNLNWTYIRRLEDHQDNLGLIYVQCRGNFKLSYKEHLYHVEVAPKNCSEMDYAKRIIFFLKKWNCLIFS